MKTRKWGELWTKPRPGRGSGFSPLHLHNNRAGNQKEGNSKTMEWLKETVDYGVIWLLVALSIFSVGIAIERNSVYKKIDLDDFPDKKSLELEVSKKLHLIATIGS